MHIGKRYSQDTCIPENVPYFIEDHVYRGNIELHWHDFYEFELIIEGSGEANINGVSHKLKTGTLSFLKPSDCHSIVETTPLWIRCIMISPSFMEKSKVLTNHKIPNFCTTDNVEYQLLTATLRYLQLPHMTHQNESALHLIEGLYIPLLQHAQNDTPLTSITQNNHVQRAIQYIHSHLHEEITLANVADSLHLNPNYLSQIFHKETGNTFQRYLSDARVHYAKRLLLNHDLSISEVCFKSGFNSLSNFLHAFKKKYGITPSQCRKEHNSL